VDPETLAEIFDSVLPRFGNEAGRYIEIDAQRKPDLDAAIIRVCLENEMSQHIKYQDVDTQPVTAPLRAGARVGRNEPCPCGSGKKYKHCCGIG
jgi:preprotein translocase subunit SecA